MPLGINPLVRLSCTRWSPLVFKPWLSNSPKKPLKSWNSTKEYSTSEWVVTSLMASLARNDSNPEVVDKEEEEVAEVTNNAQVAMEVTDVKEQGVEEVIVEVEETEEIEAMEVTDREEIRITNENELTMVIIVVATVVVVVVVDVVVNETIVLKESDSNPSPLQNLCNSNKQPVRLNQRLFTLSFFFKKEEQDLWVRIQESGRDGWIVDDYRHLPF